MWRKCGQSANVEDIILGIDYNCGAIASKWTLKGPTAALCLPRYMGSSQVLRWAS